MADIPGTASGSPEPDESTIIGQCIERLTQSVSRREREKRLTILARRTTSEAARRIAFARLTQIEPDGSRLALRYLSRLDGRIPAALVPVVVPFLRDARLSSSIRIAAAGRCLEVVPDRSTHVGPILTALTQGVARTQVLERLMRLQSRVRVCKTLDKTIEMTERKVKYRCPNCSRSYMRRQFIHHLWVRHRLTFQRGKILEPQQIVEQTINAATRTDDPELLDHAFAISRLYYPDVPIDQVLQAIAARGTIDPSRLGRLLEAATERGAGLCPVCLTAIPDPIPRLPPMLSLSTGRLAGDGYEVEIRTSHGIRTVQVRTPAGLIEPTESIRQWSARAIGLTLATLILLIAGCGTFLLPRGTGEPWFLAVGLIGLAWLTYAGLRWFGPVLPDAQREVVRLAWSELVPGIGRRPPAVRFLIRLCRASLGEGDTEDRAPLIGEMVEQAAILSDKGGVYLQFLAAARVLQVYDAAVRGRDRVSALAALFEPCWRGEMPPHFAEATAEMLLDPPGLLRNGERGRLATLLLDAAFHRAFLPADLSGICQFFPWFARLLGEPDHQTLELLSAVWHERTEPRSRQTPQRTIFDLARSAPTESAAIHSQYPDAWFVLEPDTVNRPVLGPVVLGRSGLTIAGRLLTSEAEPIEQFRDEQGHWLLFFGKHQTRLLKKLPESFLQELRQALRDRLQWWERYRIGDQTVERVEPASLSPRAGMWLAPLVQVCPLCQTSVVVRTGILGCAWPHRAHSHG